VRVFAGVDGGGSKTVCLVAAEDGTPLGRAEAGASNYHGVGLEAAVRRVGEALHGALREAAGHERDEGEQVTPRVAGLCLALAGVARPEDERAWRVALPSLPGGDGPVRITHDAMAALVGGTGRELGVVAIAGTGSIAFGVNERGEAARAGGWGYLLGDEGSGYAIGLAGLRAVCRAADGRAPASALTRIVLAYHGLDRPEQLIPLAYGGWTPADVAAHAPLVLRAAADGDGTARTIVVEAAREVALAATTVMRRLGLDRGPVEVVTAGGLWDGSDLLRRAFAEEVGRAVEGARVIPPRHEPVFGAVLLARQVAGLDTHFH
jgi:N-acetylglucosamine kinase